MANEQTRQTLEHVLNTQPELETYMREHKPIIEDLAQIIVLHRRHPLRLGPLILQQLTQDLLDAVAVDIDNSRD